VFEKNGFLEVGGFALGALLIRIGALVGTTSVLLVLILGGVRVFFNMSRDGLLPGWLARISKRGSPATGTLFYGGFTAVFAALLTLGNAVNLVNIGTLFAFFMVIVAVWVFRWSRPDVERPFRMPMWSLMNNRDGKPILPMLVILGLLGTAALVSQLDDFTLWASLTWTGIGLIFYALYSVRNSNEASHRHGGRGPEGGSGGRPASLTTGVTLDEDRVPNPPTHAKHKAAAPHSPGGAFRHLGYTLYRRDIATKAGGSRPLYFFAKATPKSGSPAPKPDGYNVGVNDRTGLPYLTKG
ncbi:MAG: basic amino acid/polyamine antiporter, family, partial [Thermoplasmata archaeon]|nr:basic amino acid/polyamine antiporter, family [Thermoplasmata archaeon]